MEAALPGHNPVIAITGPTASGKSRLALELASRFSLRLISVDSRKIYRGMDIGTAKPPEGVRGLFALVDILDPDRFYSAKSFASDAEAEIISALQKGQQPLLVGGTILYYKALFEGFFPAPQPDPELRADLLKKVKTHGSAELHKQLARVDPETASRVHPNDWIRITRALELFYTTGKTLTQLRATRELPKFSVAYVKLNPDRKTLYQNINQRVDRMMQQGLLEEVRFLVEKWGPDAPGLKTIGYRQLVDHIRGREELETAVARIKRATRTFARKQTYFMRSLKPEISVDEAVRILDGRL